MWIYLHTYDLFDKIEIELINMNKVVRACEINGKVNLILENEEFLKITETMQELWALIQQHR